MRRQRTLAQGLYHPRTLKTKFYRAKNIQINPKKFFVLRDDKHKTPKETSGESELNAAIKNKPKGSCNEFSAK